MSADARVSHLARALVDELASDPVALARLRELVAAHCNVQEVSPPAYTVASLAVELGRSERSIRAAIARGELQAIKRGRGYVIPAEAVAEWARGAADVRPGVHPPRRRSGLGPMRRGLAEERRTPHP
jgi:excisionase family DNA binding protein